MLEAIPPKSIEEIDADRHTEPRKIDGEDAGLSEKISHLTVKVSEGKADVGDVRGALEECVVHGCGKGVFIDAAKSGKEEENHHRTLKLLPPSPLYIRFSLESTLL